MFILNPWLVSKPFKKFQCLVGFILPFQMNKCTIWTPTTSFFSYLGSMDDCCNSCRLQRYAQSITNAAAICAAMGLDENWQNSIFPGLMDRSQFYIQWVFKAPLCITLTISDQKIVSGSLFKNHKKISKYQKNFYFILSYATF